MCWSSAAGSRDLSAAVAAAEAGADTMLLAGSPALGGALAGLSDPELDALIERARRSGVRLMTRTLAFGIYDHNLVCARETLRPAAAPAAGGVLRERLWKIRARAVIAAAGAFERPMIFPDNDRPGVMLAGAAERYLQQFGVACGQRVVIAANSDSAYRVAASLRAAGMNVIALVDRRPQADIGAEAPPARTFVSAGIVRVGGARAVRNCTVMSTDSDGSRPQRLECDLILSAGGHAPAVHLHSQAGGKLRWVEESSMFVPDGAAPGVWSAGACAGLFARDAAVNHAAELGAALARGEAPPPAPVRGAGRSLAATQVAGLAGKQFVDLQNDVAAGDVGLAAQENYRSVEHLKRYTTTGMGTDQGKTSNINALVLMGEFTGREPADVGTTKFRPPFAPVTLGLLAGRRVGALYRPLKYLPAHDWHRDRGALFEQFGNWVRPAAYPSRGESLEAAAQREAGIGAQECGPARRLAPRQARAIWPGRRAVSRSHVCGNDVDIEPGTSALRIAAQ